MKKIAFYTLGCKANQYQTEVLKAQLLQNNLHPTPFNSFADIYVINTCTVTQDADRKSRQAIRRAIRQNPKAEVIVTGCYAMLQKEELKKIFPMLSFTASPSFSNYTPKNPRVRAHIMIQDGCHHFCSYCIVPYARGPVKCKPLQDVIEEAKLLVAAGTREIILTGINLGMYKPLITLIHQLSSIKDVLRIRLSSIEPMYITKELIDTVAETPKTCKHLHIPLQSGDNGILKSMNRNYSNKDYTAFIEYARSKMPDCAITTDIIVGFPGEGEREFKNTIDIINQIKFSRIHIFPFSIRKGVPAAEFPNQVKIEKIQKRSKILQKLRTKLMAEFANHYVNKEVEILVEQKGEGLTSNYIRCFFNDPYNSSGTLNKISAQVVTDLGEIREIK